MAGKPGVGGRPPVPKEVKEARGTLNKTRERRVEAKVAAAAEGVVYIPVPDAPADWEQYERDAWEDLRAQVDSVGVYTAGDHAAYCIMVKLYAKFQIVSRDRVYVDDRGTERRAVETNALCTIAGKLGQYFQKFGLDPASRVRVPTKQQREAAKKRDSDSFGSGPSIPEIPDPEPAFVS